MPNTAPTGNNLADILSSMGVLTKEISEQVKMAEVQYGTRQEDIIKKQNLVSNENLVKAKAILFNIPYLDISSSPNSPEAMSILSQEVAVKFKVFPVSVDKQLKILTLAMADPMDLSAIEFVEGKTNLRIF